MQPSHFNKGHEPLATKGGTITGKEPMCVPLLLRGPLIDGPRGHPSTQFLKDDIHRSRHESTATQLPLQQVVSIQPNSL